MLKKKLQEEISRFKQINRYGKNMIMEQDVPPLDNAGTPPPPGGDVPPPPGGDVPPPPGGDLPPVDAGAPPIEGDAGAPPIEGDNVEEMDITDLVNMTKSIKKDIEDNKNDNSSAVSKMDDVFTKLNDLESKLAQMDDIISRIDQLGSRIEQIKEPTPVEKLEMRSLDSYPFNEKPREFFDRKQGEMKASGKNEYVLTKDEVMNYSKDSINNTFNPTDEEDEFEYYN